MGMEKLTLQRNQLDVGARKEVIINTEPVMEQLSEILKSIKLKETHWKEKLKFAHQLMADECQFPYKYPIILDWACKELLYNSKNNCYPDEMLAELWRIITEILELARSKNQPNMLSLQATIFEIIVKEFQSTRCTGVTFIECCKIIFSTPEYYKTTFIKFDKFLQLLMAALKSVPVAFETLGQKINTTAEATKEHLAIYFELLDIVLRLYLKLQKQQMNFKKASIGFNEKILKDISVWYEILPKFQQITEISWNGVRSEEILTQTLWNSGAISIIQGHVHLFGKDEANEENKSRKFAMLDSLFATVENCLLNESDDSTRSAMLKFVPKIFETFLTANRQSSKSLPKHFEFTIFRKFCSPIIKLFDTVVASTTDSMRFLKCIRKMLKIIVDFKVFLVIDDTVNTAKNQKCLQDLVEIVLVKTSEGSNEFAIDVLKCIEHFVQIDISLMEQHFGNIMKDVLTIDSELEDAQHVRNAKNDLLQFLLDTHAKTRSTGDFIKLLLGSIYTCKGRVHLESGFFNRLEGIAVSLPLGQSLAILQMLLDDLTKNYTSEEADQKLDEANAKSFNEAIDKLSLISKILSLFLHNIHILPTSGYPGASQERFLNLFKKLQEDVLKPIITAFPNINKKEKKIKLFRVMWRFINIIESTSLYLMDHGFASSPFLQPLSLDGQLLLSFSLGNRSFIDQLSIDDWSLYVQGIILSSRLLIISSESESYRRSFSHLEELVSYFTNVDDTPENAARQSKIGTIFRKELPWLGSFMSKDSMFNLCRMFLNSIINHLANDAGKLTIQMQKQETRPDQEYQLSIHDGRFDEQSLLLSSPYFYDDKVLQTAFCDSMVEKLSKIDVIGDFFAAIENFLKIANLADSVEGMEVDDFGSQNVMDPKGDEYRETVYETSVESSVLQEKYDTDLTSACNAVMRGLLDTFLSCPQDVRMKSRDDDSISSRSVTFPNCMAECHIMLEVMNMIKFEWLSPVSAAKLVLLTLLIRRRSYASCQDDAKQMEMNRTTFKLLNRYTGSTIAANRMAVWRIIDPVLILQLVLKLVEDNSKQDGGNEISHEVYRCVENIWSLVLSVKRNKANDEVFNQLKNEMLESAEGMSNNPSLSSVKILNTLLHVVMEAIQGRVVKKQCLVAGSQLTLPVIKHMLSLDVDQVFSEHFNEASENMEQGEPIDVDDKQEIFYDILRCYGYAFSICLLMKTSGKDQSFMAMLKNANLETLIRSTASIVQRELIGMKAEVSDDAKFFSKEAVCLEFFLMLYHHKDCTETSYLRGKDFCEHLLTSLFSILEQKHQKQLEAKNCSSYFHIIGYLINTTSIDVGYHIMEMVYERAASVLYDGKVLVVMLELLAYLFSTKCTKERKKRVEDVLKKVLYIMIEIIVHEYIEKSVTIKAHNCLVSLMVFSKDILVPSQASSVLQCILNPASSTGSGSVELLESKVKLLSNLLFNHTNAMIGGIAAFKSAVNYILQEFAVMVESGKFEIKGIMKACDSISRLYQEIASHKDVFPELDLSFENLLLIRSVLTRLYVKLENLIPDGSSPMMNRIRGLKYLPSSGLRHQLVSSILNIQKFARYFIADYLSMVAGYTLQQDYQKTLSAGIYCLMDICPTDDFGYLNAALPQLERELFKDLHSSFTKHHKFQGKA